MKTNSITFKTSYYTQGAVSQWHH